MPTDTNARKENEGSGIVAHRGFWNCEEAGFARNSVASLRCAQEAGFWGSEFAVNMTSDGVLLVHHDSDVEGKKIENNPHEAFKYFRLENGEPIPTIDDYLIQGKKYPETMLVYELKPHSSPEVEDRFVRLTIESLEKHGLLDPKRVMFISFSFHICQRLGEWLPEFTVQYLEGNMSPEEVKAAGINGIDYHFSVFDKHPLWSKEARKLRMTTNAWTVNKDEDIKRVIRHMVMYMTTDNPLQVREFLKEAKVREVR
jgi:glycerophosphoryl diester phosphodiesterase